MNPRPAGKALQSFIKTNTGGWQQSPELKKVLGIMQDNTTNKINIEMAPSPMMLSGQPAWGSGGGVFQTKTGRAFVDPFSHPTVGAHEAAHQAFPSKLDAQFRDSESDLYKRMSQQFNNNDNFTPAMVNKGASMRLLYELLDKPFMIEEANAQGVAQAAMDKAGIPTDTSGWTDMYEYPEAYSFGKQFSKAAPGYKKVFNKPTRDSLTASEINEFENIFKSTSPAVRRQFDLGYQRIK